MLKQLITNANIWIYILSVKVRIHQSRTAHPCPPKFTPGTILCHVGKSFPSLTPKMSFILCVSHADICVCLHVCKYVRASACLYRCTCVRVCRCACVSVCGGTRNALQDPRLIVSRSGDTRFPIMRILFTETPDHLRQNPPNR